MKQFLLRSAVGILLLAAAPGVHAHIIFTLGNHPQPDEANILFEASEIGVSLDNGEVDHSGAAVTFKSLGTVGDPNNPLQLLNQQAQGQADIFCALNCVNNGTNMKAQLTSIEMTAGLDAQGKATAWTDAIINLDFGTGTAKVTVTDNSGLPFTYDLGPGQNFLTMVAVAGEFITDIKVENVDTTKPGFGFNSFKQPRVSGLCELVPGTTSCTAIPTPEPASLALLGTGVVGLGLLLWRRRN